MTSSTFVVLLFLSVAPAPPTDGGVVSTDAGTPDVVRDLVRRELARLLPEGVGGGEQVEPRYVFFRDPSVPRFVTVDLHLTPRQPRGGWEPTSTGFGGLGTFTFVVDRLHLRVVSAPDGPALRARLAQTRASRARALAVAQASLKTDAAAIRELTASFVEQSGRRDTWRFEVRGADGGVREVQVETGSWQVLPPSTP